MERHSPYEGAIHSSSENDAAKSNWKQIEPKKGTKCPSPRHSHSLVSYNNDLYLFGGYGANEKYYGDLWKFETAKNRWTQVSKPSPNSPTPRHSHQAVIYKSEMFVYGGISSGGTLSDFWSYDFATQMWSHVRTKENRTANEVKVFTPRWGHSMVVFNSNIVVFGGAGKDAKATNDIALINCYTFSMTTLPVDSAELPPPRQYASMVAHDNAIYLFGGYNAHDSLNDFYRITLVDNRVVCASLAVPPFVHKLRGASLSLLPYHSQLLLFGGRTNQHLSGASHSFSLGSQTWQELPSIGPSPRYYHQTCTVDGHTYLFGGLGSSEKNKSENLNDLWTYTAKQPTFSQEFIPDDVWSSIFEHLDSDYHQLEDYYFGENVACVALVSKQMLNIVRNTPKLSKLLDAYIKSQNIVVQELDDTKSVRIVVVGECGVGKSATTVQFIMSVFVEQYDPTIEDSYRRMMDIDKVSYMLDILDTAGNETVAATNTFSDMHVMYYGQAHGLYAIYSVNNRDSFSALQFYLNKCKEIKGGRFPLIICGNKCDLEGQRQVSQDEGKAMAREYGGIWMETSARTGANISEAFTSLVRHILEAIHIKHRRESNRVSAALPTANHAKKDKCLLM